MIPKAISEASGKKPKKLLTAHAGTPDKSTDALRKGGGPGKRKGRGATWSEPSESPRFPWPPWKKAAPTPGGYRWRV